ncbi:MAG: GAF domain-containing protein, partial [Chloroflexi bacterium]|nr:GAF domain-containing protein [Chloroflexota bacterium]
PVGESISGWVLRHRTPLLVIGDEHPDPEVDALLRRGRRRRDTEAELESALCIPLEVQGRVLGVLNATKRHTTERFDEADLAVAVELARRVALAIDHARLYRDAQQQAQLQTALNDALRQTERLQRFFAPQIAELFADQEDKLHTHRRELTILFSDIRGFTSLSENLEPEELVALLNEYFSAMTEVVYEYGGTLDKYLGDGILAFFGDPVPQPDHAVRAVRAALAMQRRLAALQDHWFAAGYARLAMGIGINTGWVTVGTVGSRWRQEYTIIGDNVNVASRLTGVAGPGEIVLSEKTWRLVREHIGVVPRGAVRLKGKRQLMPIFVATDAGVEAEAL